MKEKPIVSVIVPNYNHSIYLLKRINSILAQSYCSFELILLDDCSSDDSRSILELYRYNPHVTHLVYNDTNSGTTFKQWEKGIALARGKYIWIAESDDFADPSFLYETVTVMESDPEVVVVFSGSQMVDSVGRNLMLDWDKFSNKTPIQTKYKSSDFLVKRMLWNNTIYNASMVLFRSECYHKVNQRYKDFRYCGDWLFWVEICRQGSVVSINRKLNYFRQHKAKVSPRSEKEGAYFLEGGEVIEYNISLLQLSPYQKEVVAGRSLKRLLKDDNILSDLKQRLMCIYPQLFSKGKISILLYEIDKLFNFSGLQK